MAAGKVEVFAKEDIESGKQPPAPKVEPKRPSYLDYALVNLKIPSCFVLSIFFVCLKPLIELLKLLLGLIFAILYAIKVVIVAIWKALTGCIRAIIGFLKELVKMICRPIVLLFKKLIEIVVKIILIPVKIILAILRPIVKCIMKILCIIPVKCLICLNCEFGRNKFKKMKMKLPSFCKLACSFKCLCGAKQIGCDLCMPKAKLEYEEAPEPDDICACCKPKPCACFPMGLRTGWPKLADCPNKENCMCTLEELGCTPCPSLGCKGLCSDCGCPSCERHCLPEAPGCVFAPKACYMVGLGCTLPRCCCSCGKKHCCKMPAEELAYWKGAPNKSINSSVLKVECEKALTQVVPAPTQIQMEDGDDAAKTGLPV